jgi:predicted phage terminase large subunit-like protein
MIEDIAGLSPLAGARAVMREIGERRRADREREALPKDLFQYVRAAWQVVEPATVYVHGWHIDAICEHLEALTRREIRNLIITVPPRHSKSLLCSVFWPTWVWTHTPSFRFLCMSYGAHLSLRDALKSRRVIQSPWYQERWGEVYRLTGDQNAKMRYENDAMGYRVSSSVGGMGTGEGGDAIVVDDPINLDDVHSDIIREGVNEWWDQVMSTRLNDPKTGVRLIIMQRGHETDLAGHLLAKSGWAHLNLPAEYELDKRKTAIGWVDPRKEKGELLCPERFGPREIEELKATMGPWGAAAQLQQNPAPQEGGIFKRSWFRLWPHDVRLPIFDYVIQSYDTAFTDKTQNDQSACTVWGLFKHPKTKQNCVFLVDAWAKFYEYPPLRKRVREDLRAKYGDKDQEKGVDLVLIEEKGSGIVLLQDLRMLGVPAYGYNPTRADKVVRAHAVAPFFFAGLVYLLESSVNKGQPVSWCESFIHEMLTFPNAAQDNMVDTATQTFIFLRNKELITAKVGKFEEDEENTYAPQAAGNPYSM